jgi:hypothetical protein
MSADAYLNAKAAFERVDANVTNLAQRIGKIAEVLRASLAVPCRCVDVVLTDITSDALSSH